MKNRSFAAFILGVVSTVGMFSALGAIPGYDSYIDATNALPAEIALFNFDPLNNDNATQEARLQRIRHYAEIMDRQKVK